MISTERLGQALLLLWCVQETIRLRGRTFKVNIFEREPFFFETTFHSQTSDRMSFGRKAASGQSEANERAGKKKDRRTSPRNRWAKTTIFSLYSAHTMTRVEPQVPAMYVKQPFHVQQYFDRAAHQGELAIGAPPSSPLQNGSNQQTAAE